LSIRVGGGYIGVDVFFVISGYLISGLILSEMRAGRFLLSNFYERRVRRIIPALLAMLSATSFCAYICSAPGELLVFARTLLAALFSVSNIVFWTQSGLLRCSKPQQTTSAYLVSGC